LANYILIFHPKGLAGELRSALEAAVRSAGEDIKREIRAKPSLTQSDFLSRFKTLIQEKTRAFPATIRIAILEGAERGTSISDIATKILGHDPRVEDYISIEMPSFQRIADPEFPVKFQVETGPFFTVGIYQTFGKTGSTILFGGATFLIAFLIGTLAGVDWRWTLLSAALVGGVAATITYITMSGVEAGLPIAVRK
jgi:hypothetical protein